MDKITGHRIHFPHLFLQGVDVNNHCQYSPMAVGEQEEKAWLRIMRTHNAGMKVEIMFFFDLG
jgi:hypothetical protein